MGADMTDFIALGILCLVVGFFAYCAAPAHWQTPLGFLLIAVGMMPAGLLAIVLLSKPAFLIPAALVMGVLLTKLRAS